MTERLPSRHLLRELARSKQSRSVHGGVVGSFLEMTALLGRLDAADGGPRIPKPINFSTSFLRSAGPAETRGRAEIMKQGRHLRARTRQRREGRGTPLL